MERHYGFSKLRCPMFDECDGMTEAASCPVSQYFYRPQKSTQNPDIVTILSYSSVTAIFDNKEMLLRCIRDMLGCFIAQIKCFHVPPQSALLPTLASDAAWTISRSLGPSGPSHRLLSRDQIQPTILSGFQFRMELRESA